MTESEVIRILREHFEGLFPKVCPNCDRIFPTLREYILATNRLWPTISYDAESGNWHTLHPMGSVALANCSCGTTLALGTESMPLPLRRVLLDWVRVETQRRNLNSRELLDSLRDQVRKQVLGEPDR